MAERHSRRFASLDATADYLGMSVKTVRRMVARGEITAYRLGPRLLRVDLDEVEALLRPIPTAGGAA